MDEADSDRYIDAYKAWEDAEAAYREQSTKNIAIWWTEGGGSLPHPAEVLTAEPLRTLKDLRHAAEERQAELETIARSLAGS